MLYLILLQHAEENKACDDETMDLDIETEQPEEPCDILVPRPKRIVASELKRRKQADLMNAIEKNDQSHLQVCIIIIHLYCFSSFIVRNLQTTKPTIQCNLNRNKELQNMADFKLVPEATV